ncbi:hypothetical protein SUDANB105_00699 [Streptomyces sp. enrichment culture]|uniref:hypothetical protein n=1 Tax=Streptomyces sp. enrichment culture TaxID=1795815 RepID=UPI003F56691B
MDDGGLWVVKTLMLLNDITGSCARRGESGQPPASLHPTPRSLLLRRTFGADKGLSYRIALETQVSADRIALRDLSVKVREDHPQPRRISRQFRHGTHHPRTG